MKSEDTNGEARSAEKKATLVKEFLALVVTDEEYAFLEPSPRHLYTNSEDDFGEARIMTKLQKLHPNKSRRNDSALPIKLKKIGGVISTSLKNNFNNIKRPRKFSTDLKRGIAFPFSKYGTKRKYLITDQRRS